MYETSACEAALRTTTFESDTLATRPCMMCARASSSTCGLPCRQTQRQNMPPACRAAGAPARDSSGQWCAPSARSCFVAHLCVGLGDEIANEQEAFLTDGPARAHEPWAQRVSTAIAPHAAA